MENWLQHLFCKPWLLSSVQILLQVLDDVSHSICRRRSMTFPKSLPVVEQESLWKYWDIISHMASFTSGASPQNQRYIFEHEQLNPVDLKVKGLWHHQGQQGLTSAWGDTWWFLETWVLSAILHRWSSTIHVMFIIYVIHDLFDVF